MRTSSKAALTVSVLAVAAAAVANAQDRSRDRPESLLPPGFSDPAPAQPSTAPSPRSSGAPAPRPSGTGGTSARPAPLPPPPPPGAGTPIPTGSPSASPSPDASPTIDPATLARYELPDYARRPLNRVGVSGIDGLPPTAFGNADGRYLQRLMRRIDAPVASRWLSIALRRALLSPVDTPVGVNGADFAAERSWLLVRMGEAMAARAVAQGVDPDKATPKLMQVTMQAALASGDPAGMCAYVDKGVAAKQERGWILGKAMCQGLAGEPAQATAGISQARRRGTATGIDLALAEKVAGAGSDGRRAVTIEWDGVDHLSAWRWGLAAATAVEIPRALFDSAAPQVRYWHALSPDYSASNRAGDAERAAAQGVFSNLALVDLYGEVSDTDESGSAASAIARDLRAAYIAPTAGERISALKALWDEPKDELGRYGRLVLTARAAARLRPADAAEDADRLIASILTAGLDRRALRWAEVAPRGGNGWAMMTLADPRRGALSYGDATAYSATDAKEAMFFAGLAGLGRLSETDVARGAEDYRLMLNAADPWSRAIDAAARANQPGTVLLLCAAGMQTSDWRGVRPAALYRMVAALRATGLEGYGRMIAAEAIARLPDA